MKSILLYDSPKYLQNGYEIVAKGIYKKENTFFMSFSFVQEPELEEGADSSDISQYPLEDLLDKYNVHVSDFYKEINSKSRKECVIEVSSIKKESLEEMKGIIGRHVYNQIVMQNGEEAVDLIIE